VSRIHLIIFIIFLIISAGVRVWLDKPITLPKNKPIKFEVTIKREVRQYDFGQIVYAADSRVYVETYPKYRVGDRLLIEGQLDAQGRMFEGSVKKIGEKSNLARFRSNLREKISNRIGELLPAREATLVVGTVLGVDTIGKEFRDELIKTGTIHVVVVSGQNLMIVAGIFLALAKYIGRRQSMLLAIGAVFSYAFLTGFEPPVVRASIMVLVSTTAIFLGRESGVFWSLIIAALVIIFIWPQALFEVSFQLTFAATLGIVTLGQYFQRPLKKFSLLGDNAAIATSAFIFTAPVILFYFSRVSPVAPFANILVAESVFPVMVLGFLIALATLIFMPLAQLLAYLAYVPALYFSEVVRIMAKIV